MQDADNTIFNQDADYAFKNTFFWILGIGNTAILIANDCSVNPSDLSKMLVKKQMKYFDVPLEHVWKVPVLQELLSTRMNNLYVEGFDDYEQILTTPFIYVFISLCVNKSFYIYNIKVN